MNDVCLEISPLIEENSMKFSDWNHIVDADFGSFQKNAFGIRSDYLSSMKRIKVDDTGFFTDSIFTPPAGVKSFSIPRNLTDTVIRFIPDDDSSKKNILIVDALGLMPNTTYYLTAYVYSTIPIDIETTQGTDDNGDPIDIETINDNLFIRLGLNGITPDSEIIFANSKNADNRWTYLRAKFTTGSNPPIKQELKINFKFDTGQDVPEYAGNPIYIDYIGVGELENDVNFSRKKGECFNVDLQKDINSKLTFKIRDIKKPDVFFQRSFSKTLKIPANSKTVKLFGFPEDLGSVKGHRSFFSDFDAALDVNGCRVMKGIFNLNKIPIRKNKSSIYEGRLIADNKLWFTLLKGKTLADLSWHKYNHIRSYDHVKSTYNVDGNSAMYTYPLFEERKFPNYLEGGNPKPRWKLERFTPWLFVKPLLEHIFKSVGYRIIWKGDFLAGRNFSNFHKIILYLNRYYVPFPYVSNSITSDGNGVNVDFREQLFPYRLTDIISSIGKMFNIYDITDENEKTVCLIAGKDYYADSQTKTPYKFKRDCNTPLQIEKINSNFGVINFKYQQDSNDIFFHDGLKHPRKDLPLFDEQIIIDPNNSSEANVSLIFAPTRNYTVFHATFMHIVRMEADFDGDDLLHPVWKPRVALHNGEANVIVSNWEIENSFTGQVYNETTYNALTSSDNFQWHDSSFFASGLVNTYWKEQINSYRSRKLAKGYFIIPFHELKNLDYSVDWELDDHLMRFNCIKDFDPFENKSSKVELITKNTFFE